MDVSSVNKYELVLLYNYCSLNLEDLNGWVTSAFGTWRECFGMRMPLTAPLTAEGIERDYFSVHVL